MALRLAGKPSADPRDIRRRLRQALERANERAAAAGERADATQLFGEALAPWQYEEWGRSRRRKGSNAPELTSPEHYALVLHAIVPAHVERFVRRASYTELLGPPHVGMFEPSVEYEDALAGTVATWIERQERALSIAPPLLRTYGPMTELAAASKRSRGQLARSRSDLRVTDFGLSWSSVGLDPT